MRTISLPTLKGIGSTRERTIDEQVIFVGHSVGGLRPAELPRRGSYKKLVGAFPRQ